MSARRSAVARSLPRLALTVLAFGVAAQAAATAAGAATAPRGRSAPAVPHLAAKQAAVATIDARAGDLIGLADRIWGYAELALRETRSAAALADYAEQQGFRVERGVAGLPTAFVASYGSGRPVLGVIAEYDALPGISQRAADHQAALVAGGNGHGCGHNLFGAAALGAALAARDLIGSGRLTGTVRLYGTPAEESVGGKIYMARAGLFDDVDAVVAWHPDYETMADTRGSQAMIDYVVEFHGRAAHAAADPWNGRSALDAAELFTHGLNLMREHVQPTVRMHYVIPSAGEVPNVVPTHARVWGWVRDSRLAEVELLFARLRKIAEGAALATETTATVTIQTGSYEMLTLFSGARLLHANLDWLGPIAFTAEEQDFARRIQRAAGTAEKGLTGAVQPLDERPGPPNGGSTDVADVSWIAPTINLVVTTAPADAPWHAWPVVASAGMSIGHQGMLYAAKAMAATLVDLLADPAHAAALRREFDQRRGDRRYKPFIPDGPPPLPEAAPAPPPAATSPGS